jgi:hypothetical protein
MASRGIQCDAKFLPRSFKKAAEQATINEPLASVDMGQGTRDAEIA